VGILHYDTNPQLYIYINRAVRLFKTGVWMSCSFIKPNRLEEKISAPQLARRSGRAFSRSQYLRNPIPTEPVTGRFFRMLRQLSKNIEGM
jgi:hypothetical protein